ITGKANVFDAVVLSDYNKGFFFDKTFVKQIISLLTKRNVKIFVDTKSLDIEKFKGATFIKPNNLELENAAGMKISTDADLDVAGKKYLEKSGAEALIVTRGPKGISLFEEGRVRKDFPAKEADVYDVTGAGDTVISMMALAISCGLEAPKAIALANYAASIVISKIGTVTCTREELLARINEE
ncbi:MAG: bifunctional hydroxymethylpyrimidine kinase/phosphomethylpyrimidine kinase, partial [Lachnospiraceae bacterium]|nr:bifunctional hydroxymethylpyrimidine kinase/phosphomethylpyrimidine kinase [Lachnospiraceae bacterium]